MAKYAGLVGYVTQEEVEVGVWAPVEDEHMMRGDIIGKGNSFTQADKVNDDINLSNRISLMGNEFAWKNYTHIRYVHYLGEKWKVTSIDVQRPRIIVTLGGVWNG